MPIIDEKRIGHGIRFAEYRFKRVLQDKQMSDNSSHTSLAPLCEESNDYTPTPATYLLPPRPNHLAPQLLDAFQSPSFLPDPSAHQQLPYRTLSPEHPPPSHLHLRRPRRAIPASWSQQPTTSSLSSHLHARLNFPPRPGSHSVLVKISPSFILLSREPRRLLSTTADLPHRTDLPPALGAVEPVRGMGAVEGGGGLNEGWTEELESAARSGNSGVELVGPW